MSEWKEYHLSEVGILKRGKSKYRPRYAFHLYGGVYPFIQTGDVKAAQKYINKYSQTYSEAGLQQSKLWNKGTLCITIAANIAEIGILGFDSCFPDSVLGFIADEKNSTQDYAFYLLTHAKRELLTFADGSVQDNINLGTFENIKFLFPPLPEQHAIANVLSSLDDKIDLLTRQNATLEALAQTYFRQWFVEEAREDWEEKTLGDYVACVTGVSYTSEYLQPSNVALITLKSFQRTGGFSIRGYKEYTGTYKETQIVKDGDIVVAHTDLTQEAEVIGNAVRVEENPLYKELVITMDCSKVIPKKLNSEFVYWLLRSNDFKEYCLGRSNGSTVLHLDRRAVVEFKFQMPPAKIVERFGELASSFNDRRKMNCEQIRILSSLRDILLPKLINGEVRVKH